jgi:prepilin-type processing-associated H-X9-DG protein
LIELVFVIAVLVMLAGLLLPILARVRTRAQGAECLDNLRQLQIGWRLYSGDNDGKIVFVGGENSLVTELPDANAQPGGSKSQWVLGRVDQPWVCTNVELIENGLVYPYIDGVSIYKCPADRKLVNGLPTVRSMSANCWLNPQPADNWDSTSQYEGLKTLQVFTKQTDVKSPAQTWVFMCDPNAAGSWVDIPAAYHNGAGSLCFADGHCETRKWTDQNILHLHDVPSAPIPKAPNSDDLSWLQARSTFLASQ